MKSNIEIAQEAEVLTIDKVAAKLDISSEEIVPYGRHIAKVPLSVLRRFDDRPNGKLVLTTAITPTPAGEGKTVTTIGLVQALGKQGRKVMGAIREPSLGPTFGLKGGATGGGLSQVYPMWDIDLHFTGDIHAVGAAHNLLSAILENHIAKGNQLNIDPTRIFLKKAIDMNCRELRNIVVGLGGRKEGGVPHESGFIITVASEISAILALTTSMADLKERLGRMIVGYTNDNRPVKARELGCIGAMATLLKDTLNPNLVQTLEGQPFFIHGFPFANIAHGNSSIIATKYALKMSDVVVTEAGFGADLGAEKFFDIVCRNNGFRPDCAVLVCSIKALKMHGGCRLDEVGCENLEKLKNGFANLDKHIDNIRRFGVPLVVAINHFQADTDQEVEAVREHCRQIGVRCALSDVFEKGGDGGQELADQVMEVLEREGPDFNFLYELEQPLRDKINAIATEMYGAKHVEYETAAQRHLKAIEASSMGDLMVCMAKTQLSLTDKPELKGAPQDWVLTVREIFVSAGAGFVVPICGRIMLIPGLPSQPSALNVDIDEDGKITGLY